MGRRRPLLWCIHRNGSWCLLRVFVCLCDIRDERNNIEKRASESEMGPGAVNSRRITVGPAMDAVGLCVGGSSSWSKSARWRKVNPGDQRGGWPKGESVTHCHSKQHAAVCVRVVLAAAEWEWNSPSLFIRPGPIHQVPGANRKFFKSKKKKNKKREIETNTFIYFFK
jgi:hypothetical protein